MFILTDQFLADSYRSVKPFEIKNLPSVKLPTANSSDSVYKRYAFTENGISPRLLPGINRNLVVADSDEHTEDGHITEDLSIRTKMVKKRMKKNTGIIDAIVPPEFNGHANPDILFVSWGSSKGPVIETINKMNEGGGEYASLHFSQVWPLNPAHFTQILKNAGKVVCVEGNATAQFARLIRRETGFNIEKRILKYDGLPFTPEAIIKSLNIS
ncbi:MAG: 2-oxoacid:acceptor oxidoreductase subunit alpha, partial [Desulfobacterales bacterium]|nr:2-oxoacid:acceptor oxidoreductase subunit alpha [Desulfobacterales bacterium]